MKLTNRGNTKSEKNKTRKRRKDLKHEIIEESFDLKPNNDGMYVCPECDKGYRQRSGLEEHIYIKHQNHPPKICNHCNFKSFSPYLYAMEKHMRNRHLPKQLVCHICAKTFGDSDILKNHMIVHAETKQFKCDVCPKAFAQRSGLKLHKDETHHQRKTTCEVCGRVFNRYSSLYQHRIIHHKNDGDDNTCEVCNKVFDDANTAYCHMAQEHGVRKKYSTKTLQELARKFECDQCGYTTHLKTKLTDHMRRHTKEKPFECRFCSAKFGYRGTLSNHEKCTHLARKPVHAVQIKCDSCEYTSPYKSMMKIHAVKHTKEKVFLCNICGAGFGYKGAFNNHLRKVHGSSTSDYIVAEGKVEIIEDEQTLDQFNLDAVKKFAKETEKKEVEWDGMNLMENENFQPGVIVEQRQKQAAVFKVPDQPSTPSPPIIVAVSNSSSSASSGNTTIKKMDPYPAIFYIDDDSIERDIEKFINDLSASEDEISAADNELPLYPDSVEDLDTVLQQVASEFGDVVAAEGHAETEPTEKLECDNCDYKTTLKIQMRNHMVKHTKVKPFICQICLAKFGWRSALWLHTKHHHPDAPQNVSNDDKKFKCDECDYTTDLKTQIKNHMVKHTKEKPFSCDICDAKFAWRHTLWVHKKNYHSETKPEHVCPYCGKVYNLRSSLKDHMVRQHESTHKLACSECEYTTTRATDMKNHMKVKHLPREFVCHICAKAFAKNYTLKMHMYVHEEEKQFKCQLCPKSFAQKGGLQVHMRNIHIRPPQECKDCGQVFPTYASFYRHQVFQHNTSNKVYSCDACTKVYKNHIQLYNHKRIVHKVGVKDPSKKPPKKPPKYGCTQCKFKTALRCQIVAHMVKHTKEKPFCCDTCGKKFGYRRALLEHDKKFHRL